MSFKVVDQVSGKANVIMSGVVSGVTDVASSVSHSVEEVVSSFSTGVGDVVHNVSAGMKRLMTSPPCEDEIQREIEASATLTDSILPTPDDSGIAERTDRPYPTMGLPFCPASISSSDASLSLMEEANFDDHIGIFENYFSEPEIFEIGSDATMEDIENAIQKVKSLILSCEESTQKRRVFVQRLIQLRLMVERMKEEREVSSEGVQVVEGHQLVPVLSRLTPTSKQFCDKCMHVIWSILHVTYQCSFCNYQCHGKCIQGKHPKCPSLKYDDNPSYNLDICPENGLSYQNYRCAQCRNLLTGKSAWNEPRLCDYTGEYFCPACHWNTLMTSPARVIHNWDFDPYPVSQRAKHFLNYMNAKPLLLLEEINPQLFRFVEELQLVKKLREDLIVMKDYLRTCRAAQEGRLLRRLDVRQHFVDNAKYYSMKDLIDLNEELLLPFLKDVHKQFEDHIKNECEGCRGKGFICELCSSEEVIFPFDDQVAVCGVCQASFHDKCFASITLCPRCIRQSSRRLKSHQEEAVAQNLEEEQEFVGT